MGLRFCWMRYVSLISRDARGKRVVQMEACLQNGKAVREGFMDGVVRLTEDKTFV